jgi:hypothetical protein
LGGIFFSHGIGVCLVAEEEYKEDYGKIFHGGSSGVECLGEARGGK